MALTNDFKVKNGLTVTDSISAGGNVSASNGFFDGDVLASGSFGTHGWQGDSNTHMKGLGDRILFTVGGLTFADFSEGSQDLIHFNGNENQDIDFRVGYNGGASIFSRGSDGNVGIGTASPSQKLEVAGRIRATTDPTFEAYESSTKRGGVQWNASSDYLNIFSVGGDIVFDANGGNVGIGTTSPSERLVVQATNDSNLAYEVGSGGYTGNSGGVLNLTGYYDYTGSRLGLYVDNAGKGNIATKTGQPLVLSTNNTEKLRITSAGNVGIGTTSPAGELEVQGTGDLFFLRETGREAVSITGQGNGSGSQMIFKTHSGSSLAEAMRILPSGNVGIGTTSPSQKLDVNGAARFGAGTTRLTTYSDSSYAGIYNGSSLGSDESIYMGGGGIFFIANTAERMRITGDGRVGIGTTSPDYQLDIENSSHATARLHAGANSSASLRLKNDAQHFDVNLQTNDKFAIYDHTAGTQPFTILPTSGNVGIGTTAPSSLLHIAENDNGGNAEIILENSFTNTGSSTDETTQIQGRFGGFDGSYIITGKEGDYTTAALRKSFLSFSTRTATTGMGEKMRITSTGNVGIGNTNPTAAKLIVRQDSGYAFRTENASGYTFRIAGDTGNIEAAGNITFGDSHTIGNDGNSNLLIQSSSGENVTINGNTDVKLQDNGNTKLQTTSSGVTITGDINTSGNILSGGVNIDTLFGSGGGGTVTSVTAGTGMTQSGTSTVNPTLNVIGGTGITANANDVAIDTGVVMDLASAQTATGTKNFSGDICVGNKIIHTGDSDTYFQFASNDVYTVAGNTVAIRANASETVINDNAASYDFRVEGDTDTHALFVDGSTDRVGVGCSSPTAKLDINQTATTRAFQVFRNVDQANTEALAYFTDEHASSTQPTVRIRNDGSGDSLQVRKESTAQLHVKSDGKVGIGTDSPAYKLDVAGTTESNTFRTPTGSIVIDGQDIYSNCDYNGNDGSIRLNRYGYQGGQTKFRDVVIFNGKGSSIVNVDGSSGNVGIGTTSPASRLQVSGGAQASGTIAAFGNDSTGFSGHGMEMRVIGGIGSLLSYNRSTNTQMPAEIGGSYVMFDVGGVEKMRVNTSGNVGIGCTNPTEKLAVAGDGLFTSNLTVQGSLSVTGAFTCLDTTISVTSAMDITNHGTGPALLVNQTGSNDIVDFRDDGTSAFYIEDGGNVGIGTTDPSEKLEVAGKVSTCEITTASGTLTLNPAGTYVYLNAGKRLYGSNIGFGYQPNGVSAIKFLLGASIDSPDMRIERVSSNLLIQNEVDDGDIIFKSDNGSGGVAEYFKLDGSVADGSNVLTRFPDQSILGFGSGNGFQDGLQIYHNGSHSYINNYVGNLEIVNNTNDGDISFKSDDGSGGGAEYLRLDGGTTTIQAYKDLLIANDTAKLKLGASQDLQIFHNGTHSYVDSNNTGDLYLRSLNDDVIVQAADDVFIYAQGGEDAIIAKGNGGVELYYDNSKKFATTTDGIQLYGNGYLDMPDNGRLRMGASYDLAMYHNGTHSYLTNNVTGSLYIQSGNSVQIESSAGENMIVASANGAVQLYYDNCSKLQTTCSGISICGNALVSGHVCATTKSFVIDNPTTDGKLRYSVVEGNEHGVTVRGSTCCGTIELPDEWDWLVEEDSVTAQITPVGGPHHPYVVSQDNKQVVVCSDGCYNYNVYGTRKDVKPLEVNIS